MWVTAASLLYLLMACHGMDIHNQDSLAKLMNECVAVDGYVSPYVLAFTQTQPTLRGCESASRAGPAQSRFPREVHVLNVLHDVERVDGSPPHVTVRLEPSSPTGVHQGPLVLVLVAPSPVTWRVSTQRISNQSRIIFVIQAGSRVVKLNPLRQKIRRETDLPTGSEELMRWVSSKHRALTSLTEAPHATTYLKKVGAGRAGRTRCELADNFSSPNSVVTYLDREPTHACSVSKNENTVSKDIHVIELLPPANSSSPVGPSEVRLDISMTQRSARDRHLLLLLKGHRDVTWKIHVAGMRGDLDIIAQIQNNVNTDEVNPKQTVRLSMEQLDAYSGAQLRQWAINKEGPLVSYTRVAGAHRLNLIIDGPRGRGGMPGAAGKGGDRPGEDSRAQDDQHVVGPVGTQSPFQTRAKTWAALNQAKQVRCTSRSMEVLLRKQILMIHGIRREHLSLLAPECLAADNKTHLILHTELNTCGTDFKVHGDNSYVTYQNAILVHDVELSDVAEDLGSADLSSLRSLLAASEAADHTRVDDEDYAQSDTGTDEIRVDFSCEYSIGAQHNPNIEPEDIDLGTGQPTPPVGDRHFNLAIYKDSHYSRVVNEWPLSMDRDRLVYLQADMSGDDNLHLIIQNCWVAATKFPEPMGKRLIENGCPKTTDVRMDESDATKVRFSFRFRESVRAYVGCQLTVCARDEASRTDGIPLCTPRNCLPVGPVLPLGPTENAAAKAVFTGPLVPPKTRGDGSDGENRTPQDPAHPDAAETKACQEVIHVEGLDSGTVVGISFAAFIIGVLLTAALWVIHTHTGPYRQANRPRSTETSGESTPSSTAPITIHHIHT